MPSINSVSPSFIVKNISTKTMKLLGRIPVRPNVTIDLFKAASYISESEIIDSLRAPNGAIYREVNITRAIEIISYNLLTLNNIKIDYNNISTKNAASVGQVLSVDANNKLTWVFGDMAARLRYEAPLVQTEGGIALPKADAYTDGFLGKDDWIIFKGKSKGLRIWQYQDFSGPFTNPLKLGDFANGRELSFNANLIVDGTAVVVDVKNSNTAPRAKAGLGGIFSNKLTVSQHVRDAVFLNEQPDKGQRIRIYFLIILSDGINVPVDYSPPTEYVRKMRIEYFDAIDIDSGGAKSIFGEKVFNDNISVRTRFVVGEDIKDGKLSVSGNIACDSIKVREGAADGHVLVSNTIGVAEWQSSPSVLSTPPVPFNGRMWIREPDYIAFIYDGQRKKWLSTSETFSVNGSKNATSCSNCYMNSNDNISYHINGLSIPYNSTLVGLVATGESNQSWIAEVHVNNKLIKGSVLHVVNSSEAHNTNLNIDFKEGAKVQLFISGTGISMPIIRAIFKRRA